MVGGSSISGGSAMDRHVRNWLAGMGLLGVALVAYMLLQGSDDSWSLQEEIAQTDTKLIRERSDTY